MPLTYKMQLRLAKEVGVAIAKSYYEIFSNPTNRGPKFTWEEFPNMCRRAAEIHVNIALPHKVKAQQEVESVAGETAYEEATRFLENKDDQTGT
jgi:hypothetical protein